MAKIKHITVSVHYSVGLGSTSVSKEVQEELDVAARNCHTIHMDDRRYPAAAEWLRDNIREEDCTECEYEIEDINLWR